MSLTPEENATIAEIRRQITDLLSQLNHLAVQVGAEPIPSDALGVVPVPPPGPMPLNLPPQIK